MNRTALLDRLQPAFTQAEGYAAAKLVSMASLLYHNFAYEFLPRNTHSVFETGMIVVSIDVDVGSMEVGLINKGENDINVSDRFSESKIGQIEENVFPTVLNFFNDLEAPVTIALRGQLAEVDTSFVDMINDSPVRHDVGSHGYYHKRFTEMTLEEASSEMNLVSKAMKAFHLKPETFIFPRNKIAHLELIRRFGYVCYRECGGFARDGMYIRRVDGLYDVHPSLYVTMYSSPTLIRRIVDISAEKRLPFHLWFHCVDFGNNEREMRKNTSRVLLPVFKYAKKKAEDYNLRFETMLSATERAQARF